MNRKVLFSALLVTWVALTFPAMSQGGPHGGPPPPLKWWRVPEFTEKMALTQDEMRELDALYIESHTKLIDAEADKNKAKLILDDLLDKTELDEKAVFAQLEKVNQALSTINSERFRFLIEIRKFLGAKRFSQLKGIFEEHRMRMMKDKRGGPPRTVPGD